MSRNPSCLAYALACTVAALALPDVARAIEWSAEPRIGVGAEYNDNIFLTTVTHEAVHGVSITPSLDFSARQPNWELRSSTRLTDKRYAGRSDISGDNGTETLTYKFNTERSLLQLKGSYTDEAAWSGNTYNSDIGLVQTNIRRYTTVANPTWMWALTETLQLSADYRWSAVQYEKGQTSRLLDYQQQVPSLTLTDQLTERTKLTAAVAYSDYEITTSEWNLFIPTFTRKSRTNFAQLGVTHDFTESLKGSLSAGPRKTTQQVVGLPWVSFPLFMTQAQCYQYTISTGQDPAFCFDEILKTSYSHGTIFNGSLESTLERTHSTLSLSRSVDGSGSGSQVENTNASVRIDHQLTPERFSASFAADGYLVKALGVTTTIADRHYYSLSPGLRWRWTENLSLDGSYRYTRQRYVGNSDYARSNAVYISLTYNWPKFSVSR